MQIKNAARRSNLKMENGGSYDKKLSDHRDDLFRLCIAD